MCLLSIFGFLQFFPAAVCGFYGKPPVIQVIFKIKILFLGLRLMSEDV